MLCQHIKLRRVKVLSVSMIIFWKTLFIILVSYLLVTAFVYILLL